jgi:hypothetical protein
MRCVKVKLSNVADEAAALAGRLPLGEVRSMEVAALVDTGAVRSCVPQTLLDRLGIQPAEHTLVEYANGQKEAVGLAYGILFNTSPAHQ